MARAAQLRSSYTHGKRQRRQRERGNDGARAREREERKQKESNDKWIRKLPAAYYPARSMVSGTMWAHTTHAF